MKTLPSLQCNSTLLPGKKREKVCSLNLHAIQELNSTAFNVIGQSLSEDLGFFGGAHIDQNDSAGGTTCMVAYSDLPKYYDVG